MIVQPRGREARAHRSAANRELAVGLVLVALVSAFLVHYGLGYACRSRTGWPCRPSDVQRAGQVESIASPDPAHAPLSGPEPFYVPTLGLPTSPGLVAAPTPAWPTEPPIWPTDAAGQPTLGNPPTVAMPIAPVPVMTTEVPLPTFTYETVTPPTQAPGTFLPAPSATWSEAPGTSYP